MSRLGDTIRAARLKKKMTEKALGKKCGMAENVIKDIEAGRRIVSDDQAQRILKVLGTDNPISTELDVAAEPEVSLWDLAPLAILVAEAGGRFTSLAGVDGPHGGDAIATNGLLHDSVLDYLK